MTFGAISASPLAAAWIAWLRSSGLVLEQEAAGSCLECAVHSHVEVEGGDHNGDHRVLGVRPGESSSGLEPVDLGHAEVEWAPAGSPLASEPHRLATISRLSDHRDVRLGVEELAVAAG